MFTAGGQELSHRGKTILWASIGGFLLAVVVVLRLFSVWATTLPLDMPIHLDRKEAVNVPIKVRTPEFDTLAVVFSTAELPLFSVRKLSGGQIWENEQWVEYPPAPMSFAWKLSTPAGELLSEGQGSVGQEVTSYGTDQITRTVARLPVTPGDYRLQINVLTPDARFAEVSTRLALVAEGRGKTWQTSVAWWGSLLSGMLLIPVILICALVALYHFTRWRYGQPRIDSD
jgi:hypothetical protein